MAERRQICPERTRLLILAIGIMEQHEKLVEESRLLAFRDLCLESVLASAISIAAEASDGVWDQYRVHVRQHGC
jgi:hypothetical protein